MNIIILTEKPFPYGMASTNRLIIYTKGLVECSQNVKVCCIKPTENSNETIRNTEIKGIFEGIEFEFFPGRTVRSRNIAGRIYYYLKGFFRSIIFLYKFNRGKGIDVIFMGLSNFYFTFSYYLFTRIFKIKFVQERSEYPFIGVGNSIWKKINLNIYLSVICKFFDGFIVISESLREFFLSKIRKNGKIMILPILVEPQRFQAVAGKLNETYPYIAYCGSMQGNKDGVPILIEAFYLISEKYKNLKLYLIGDTFFSGFNEIRQRIINLKLNDRIVFTGRVERDEIPVYLTQARLLALARPESKQAEGGFPSKLGEYLATGNPVVVTRVGEIPLFMKDGVNAFISEPNVTEKFAAKLDEALSDPDLSAKVGIKGQELAFTIFNYKIQAEKLKEFIEEL